MAYDYFKSHSVIYNISEVMSVLLQRAITLFSLYFLEILFGDNKAVLADVDPSGSCNVQSDM